MSRARVGSWAESCVMSGLKIRYLAPESLKPRLRNPRTHSPKQIQQIAASIRQFGFVSPVLVEQNGGIIAGHGRVSAAKLLGMPDIPTVRVDYLSPAQIRAYVIADNKLAENAGWDRTLLAQELKELEVEPNFDVGVIGFETAEVDILIGELDQDQPDEADAVPAIDRSRPAVTSPGDVWKLGNHVLLCGDALEKSSFRTLLSGNKAQMVFTDPPYNVPVQGHVSGKGRIKHEEFSMASGEMSPSEFTDFLKTAFARLTEFSADGSIHFVCMDWRHMREVLIGSDAYSELKNLCVWTKTNGGMGSLYRSQHELVFVFKHGTAPHINNVELGRFGRNRSNVWSYVGATAFHSARDSDLALHPTTKPLALVADAIMDCSKRGGIILDAFAGSGTTLMAAEKTGRRGYGMEIDPYYVDTIIRRFAEILGVEAVHAETGKPFHTTNSQRRSVERTSNAKESGLTKVQARQAKRRG